MQGVLTLVASLGLVGIALAAAQSPSPAELKPGDAAPAFTLPGSDGRTYSLADFRNKQPVVLAWYPKAFTGG